MSYDLCEDASCVVRLFSCGLQENLGSKGARAWRVEERLRVERTPVSVYRRDDDCRERLGWIVERRTRDNRVMLSYVMYECFYCVRAGLTERNTKMLCVSAFIAYVRD